MTTFEPASAPVLRALGLGPVDDMAARRLTIYAGFKLSALGLPAPSTGPGEQLADIARALLATSAEKDRLLDGRLCPVDQRLQDGLDRYLRDLPADVPRPRLPGRTLVLDRHGLARLTSVPPDRDEHDNPWVSSRRCRNGILHNPVNDRRTTQGVFHVADGGLPIPADKPEVPRAVYARLLDLALRPPPDLATLPYTASLPAPARCFVSLLLRPVVQPAVPGWADERSLEIRFFAPGALVSNLDFVESIFGNGGDPLLPENDAALDPARWTGHSGGVLLAPHLVAARKRDLGLPRWEDATPRQQRDGMAWRDPDETYNGGRPFKICARDASGFIFTIIADNYFGYCKKEVKTQISFSANLAGLAEEEHAGGTFVFPTWDLDGDFAWADHFPPPSPAPAGFAALLPGRLRPASGGSFEDTEYPDIHYVPGQARFRLADQEVAWTDGAGTRHSLRLRPGHDYVLPWGYRVRMVQSRGGGWRLAGTSGHGLLLHKPCTVSGGGKSEISKPVDDALLRGPAFVADFEADLARVDELLHGDYSHRHRPGVIDRPDTRPVLSADRSLGSVIKLFTPSPDFTPEYNAWLASVPHHLRLLAYIVKRHWRPEWGRDWRSHFSVRILDGRSGNRLELDGEPLIQWYLRVGYRENGSWRVFTLRDDFLPAAKIATEDDITASVTLPAAALGLTGGPPSRKFIHNCEYRFFQRPDDAIHPGYDHGAEADVAQPGNFLSNYQPLTGDDARAEVEDVIGFERFTAPLREIMAAAARGDPGPAFFVSTHRPRLVDGKPSKNPRYLQTRPSLLNPRPRRLGEICLRLAHNTPPARPVVPAIDAVLPGRRNNPPDREAGVPALCVHNPIHYYELPEFLAEVICSMTGRSPSTTGAGSEGALTKGPFNALCPVADLENALLSLILTGSHCFVTSAGTLGPRRRIDHDISLLVPEVWARMAPGERDPSWLISRGMLERCADVDHGGRRVPASLLGWRITQPFVLAFFGRIFCHPDSVLTSDMLRPEEQDPALFAEGVATIEATMRRVAALYFEDGSAETACPPLRRTLEIMRDGDWSALADPAYRSLFTLPSVLDSAWYQARLERQQRVDVEHWQRGVRDLEAFLARPSHRDEAARLGLAARLADARTRLTAVSHPDHLARLRGTIGRAALG